MDIFWNNTVRGVANGKIWDFPRCQDPCLKIQDRNLKFQQDLSLRLCTKKTEPKTSFCKNLSRFPKLFAARHELHDILRLTSIFWFQFLDSGHYHGNISSNEKMINMYSSFWSKLFNIFTFPSVKFFHTLPHHGNDIVQHFELVKS